MIFMLRLIWDAISFSRFRERRYMTLKQRQKRYRKMDKKFGTKVAENF
jgi:hypothetical protein